ncbi:hypothetical protein [Haloplanus halophilus]|uniref:hypothetical protein n=1 Tax=Haloplanus halophilus TaxID=2949993 RepID=UPI00203A3FCA|nr:hypothetical protein [Haloplanus sp. GDY1]
MTLVPRPWSSDDDDFDDYDAFRPATLPEPGPFLDGHAVLTGRDHAAFHRLTRACFEARTVYDVTFGYNLARLNLDTRHPDAGYRYAVEADDPSVLRAEFTPTTEFCPQSDTLATASFRAWNADDAGPPHEFDLVRVRVAPMHEASERINGRLVDLEGSYRGSGSVPEADADGTLAAAAGADATDESATDGPSTPF